MNQMQQMMRQAQKMQAQILKIQEEMAGHREEATAGGVVTVGASGKGEIVDVRIDPAVARPEDVEMLQDLITVAANEALAKARAAVEAAMKKVAGPGLPGLF
jgi:DNA-binding YbaB/EbfC family protein